MVSFAPFLDDYPRWLLWWPVGMGIGISTYSSLSYEPSLFSALLPFLASLAALSASLYFWRGRTLVFLACMAASSISLGFAVAKVRTDWLSTPFLPTKVEGVFLEGRIVDIEERPHRRRLTLDNLAFPQSLLLSNGSAGILGSSGIIGKGYIPTLHRIRLTMPLSKPLGATMGDRVSLMASLLPLSDPVSINGYNFRRQAYFQGIGATGQIKGNIRIVEKSVHRFGLDALRYRLTQTIRQRLTGQTGEIAAALITGDRSGIDPTIRQAFTDAGLAHILAISGLHLTLVAGLVFLVFRRGLALVPFFAENYPIKKWSAVLVMMAAFAYLAISGFGIPGQRAFVMISIVMLGVLLDRNPLSMRLVAIAAAIILLVRPESLLSASFQLSFAAVVGLIAAYEGGWGPLREWASEGGYIRKGIASGAGLVATTLIATVATTPYTLAIFNRFTLQAIAGNFLAIPLTSLLIMPAATLSVLTLPFGGGDLPFHVLSFGLEGLIWIAKTVSAWPGAAIMVATPPPAFLGLVTLGGLWLCLWTNVWRWGGLAVCGLGFLCLLFPNPPTIYAAADGVVMAYQSGNVLYVSDLKRGGFFTDQWMKELGLTQKEEWPNDSVRMGSVLLVRPTNFPLRLSKKMCQERVLVTTGYAGRSCQRWGCRPNILIDRYTLKRKGTHQIWITSQGYTIKSVRSSLGKRPWNYRYEWIKERR